MKIVAVNGSLVGDGNVKALLDHALAEYDGKPQFAVKRFAISGMTIDTAFQALSMVVASPDLGVHGAAAFASIHGTGETQESDGLLVKSDTFGMASARSVAYRVGELATLIEAGRQAKDPGGLDA